MIKKIMLSTMVGILLAGNMMANDTCFTEERDEGYAGAYSGTMKAFEIIIKRDFGAINLEKAIKNNGISLGSTSSTENLLSSFDWFFSSTELNEDEKMLIIYKYLYGTKVEKETYKINKITVENFIKNGNVQNKDNVFFEMTLSSLMSERHCELSLISDLSYITLYKLNSNKKMNDFSIQFLNAIFKQDIQKIKKMLNNGIKFGKETDRESFVTMVPLLIKTSNEYKTRCGVYESLKDDESCKKEFQKKQSQTLIRLLK